ncbi:sensor histidine kinase [Paenibacillus sp. FJAT-26967]|uniref:ATP-binding protein n=1 Tax=Paenibacillus sp. FJAT-26967 TaxID=1729690 RepID=UPI000837D3BF|nr:sensor histidine kinase [Paenibacillus sp. FJAT-26967]
MRLQTKMILIICTLLLGLVVVLGAFFEYILQTGIEEQIGTRALKVAEMAAMNTEILEAMDDTLPSTVIQPIAEGIRLKTGAEYVVVGNAEGIRHSHPLPDRIGKPMIGGDNDRVFAGHPVISKAVGSMGMAIRGKAPLLDDAGKVVGVVSVGFLMEDVESVVDSYSRKVVMAAAAALALGSLGAIYIARRVKKETLGLEPEEIGALYLEKEAILESIREGVIAVNARSVITMVNQAAVKMIGGGDPSQLLGKPLQDIFPASRLGEVLQTGKAEFDQQMIIGEHEAVENRIPIFGSNGIPIGAVSSFRSKSELFRLADELSQVKRYAEALRAQTHEFSNKLYVISGLIQLESYQEAIDMISRESNVHQSLIQFIMREVPDPIIGGLLIGKFNRAHELKVDLQIDEESSLKDIPKQMDRNHLITILGNLLDNAMEATLTAKGDRARSVGLFMTDLGEDLIIECEDNGPGIMKDQGHRIFENGFTTKEGQSRGIGLALVRHAVNQLGGFITYRSEAGEGTLFTVILPKHQYKPFITGDKGDSV